MKSHVLRTALRGTAVTRSDHFSAVLIHFLSSVTNPTFTGSSFPTNTPMSFNLKVDMLIAHAID